LTFNDEEPIKLSPKENELLKMLILHENDLMPRELALTKIWRDDNYFTSRSMDVYIAKLRKYLKLDDNVEILNIHGEGFRLVVKTVEKKKAPRNRSFFFCFFFIRPTKD
jgi:DNA-binding response OmpR family regulator